MRGGMYDLAVIGGGASGLCAAITAFRRGKSVVVFEKEKRTGQKILVSGNGKCNLSNTDMRVEKYNTRFVGDIIKTDVVDFFGEIGLMTKNVGNRVYPYSESAADVLNVLRAALPADAERTDCGVREIVESDGFFSVNGENARNVALCTGSAATKGTESYCLYEKFGHRVTALRPSIVPLFTDVRFLAGLDGIRVKADVSLIKEGMKIYTESGEILFRTNGISGIAAMMLSTYIARNGGVYGVSIDFAPDKTEREIEVFLNRFSPEGILRKAVARQVALYAESSGLPLCRALKDFRVGGARCAGKNAAQVMCGGLDTSQFDRNLESRLKKGLYACGEALDVDGECGGYNLHFAFASGIKVGESI